VLNVFYGEVELLQEKGYRFAAAKEGIDAATIDGASAGGAAVPGKGQNGRGC
jgi:hypothetical protein